MGHVSERVAESYGIKLLSNIDFGGRGDGMHINVHRGFAYFAHQHEGGTSIVDVRDPRDPRIVGNIPSPPNTHSHKVQIVDDVLLVNRERVEQPIAGLEASHWTAGLSIYDISDPTNPREIAFWSCGGRGVHRMTYWSEPYAYVTAGSSDFENQILVILDLSDPAKPVEASRWWLPGMRYGEEHLRTWGDDRRVKLHHGVQDGDRLYCGWWDAGVVTLDIGDVNAPKLVNRLDLEAVDGPSRNTHSVIPLPGRDALVVTDEATERYSMEFQARIVDITDETASKVLSRFPVPDGDYRSRGGRFGPHNIHEGRPGSLQRYDRVYMSYFSGGVRIFDIADLSAPEEIAFFVPKAPRGRPSVQINDLFVDADGLIYASDRQAGGLYIMAMDEALA